MCGVFDTLKSSIVSVNDTIQLKIGQVCKLYLVDIETGTINHVEHDVGEFLPLWLGSNSYGELFSSC